MINTLNESSLHKALKTFYAVQFSAQEEVKVGRWICDLETSDGGIVEIQNKNVGALKEKIQGLLELKRRVTIVHPIITQKTIETRGQDGSLVSKRKSPKKENLYSELKEFTSIAELLHNKNLSLLLPEITIVEKRVQCAEPVQAKNGRRRFKKAWQKTGKALLTIGGSYKLNGKKDWLALLPSKALAGQKTREKKSDSSPKKGAAPSAIQEPFSAATVRDAFIAEQKKEAAPYANLLLWILRKAGLIERVPHEGRGYWYVLSQGTLRLKP